MATLPCLTELGAVGTTPALRVRGVRALMAFNALDADRALALDRALAAAHSTSAALYTLGCKRLMFNLASNPALHAVPADRLLFLSEEEMARDTVVERVQQQERARHEAFLDMLREKQVEQTQTESVIHCRRCRSANLNFLQVQTRSADEPMTCFLTCGACGHKWRMS